MTPMIPLLLALQEVQVPAVIPVTQVVTPAFTPWQILVMTLPAIIAQIGALVGALSIFYGVWSKRTREIQNKAEEIHTQNQTIIKQADTIAEQTNGHLSRITDEGAALREALMQVLTIVSAREGHVPGVRDDDLPKKPVVEKVVRAVDAAVNNHGAGGQIDEPSPRADIDDRVQAPPPPPPERRKKPR